MEIKGGGGFKSFINQDCLICVQVRQSRFETILVDSGLIALILPPTTAFDEFGRLWPVHLGIYLPLIWGPLEEK